MLIGEMFERDVNRRIGGAVKVDLDSEAATLQEVDEYVITRELKNHFMRFFDYYSKSFSAPAQDTGIWVSGQTGSGKSHFLKMLSYILENKPVGGIPTVERFRKKFADDPVMFMMIENSMSHVTETIRFDAKEAGSEEKDSAAVLRMFAAEFYKHQGRPSKQIPEDFSVSDLVTDIKSYLGTKPWDFRLIFMADDMGEYIGTDTGMFLALQTLSEKIGSDCSGKVWIACSGQVGLDEIMKLRSDEFSVIQARFKTRMSLSASSLEEIVQKRLLQKTPEVERLLESLFYENDDAFRLLFSFSDCMPGIKGYGMSADFSLDYPFVPYQFPLVQKIFSKIKEHRGTDKFAPGGERSILSVFLEAVQKIQEKDVDALVPFYVFYDTVQTYLDSSTQRVVERCERAAKSEEGMEPQDVEVLKILYLMRYADDIPMNIDNIAILMADDIHSEKPAMREEISGSLERLAKRNYIGREGDRYTFMTDEGRDVAKSISDTFVDPSEISSKIGNRIFGEIYVPRKFRYKDCDFALRRMVDGKEMGEGADGENALCLEIMTVAAAETKKTEIGLMTESKGKAVVVLQESSYRDPVENALKIRTYIKQHNVSKFPAPVQEAIRIQQEEAARYEVEAVGALKEAIESATFYVDGERLALRGGDARQKIEAALGALVDRLGLIEEMATPADLALPAAREFLLEYFGEPDVPEDADGVAKYIVEKFTAQRDRYAGLDRKYDGHKFKYPNRPLVKNAIAITDDVLGQKGDAVALMTRMTERTDELYESRETMRRVENFFENHVGLFDEAADFLESLRDELYYLSREPEADAALNQIMLICTGGKDGKFDYNDTPQLSGLVAAVSAAHGRLVAKKREEILGYIGQCMDAVRSADSGDATGTVREAEAFYESKKRRVAEIDSLALLDAQIPVIISLKDETLAKIEGAKTPDAQVRDDGVAYKPLARPVVFPSKRLRTADDIDAYLSAVRESLINSLAGCDGLELK